MSRGPRRYEVGMTLSKDMKTTYYQKPSIKNGPNIFRPVRPPIPRRNEKIPNEAPQPDQPKERSPPRLIVLENYPDEILVLGDNLDSMHCTKTQHQPKNVKEMWKKHLEQKAKERIRERALINTNIPIRNTQTTAPPSIKGKTTPRMIDREDRTMRNYGESSDREYRVVQSQAVQTRAVVQNFVVQDHVQEDPDLQDRVVRDRERRNRPIYNQIMQNRSEPSYVSQERRASMTPIHLLPKISKERASSTGAISRRDVTNSGRSRRHIPIPEVQKQVNPSALREEEEEEEVVMYDRQAEAGDAGRLTAENLRVLREMEMMRNRSSVPQRHRRAY